MGSRSLHLQSKRDRLLQYRDGESDSYVRLWIDEYVLALDKVSRQRELRKNEPAFKKLPSYTHEGEFVRLLIVLILQETSYSLSYLS